MATMIERVARAMVEEEWGANTWPSVSNGARRMASRRARAAIVAMREPTEGMADILGEVGIPVDFYTRMIDAALEEKP